MLQKILSRARIEYRHFVSLSTDARKVLISYAFFLVTYPMIFVFVNAYLWRDSGDINTLIWYNLANFVGIPLGFYLNGLLLRHFHIKKLYALGALLQGVAPLLVIFSPATSMLHLVVYGFLFGVGGGFYWANKNYLTLKATRGSNRIYYNSLERIVDLSAAIVAPVVAGYLIIAGEGLGLYSIESGYRVTILLALLLLVISGAIVASANIGDMQASKLFVNNPSKAWWHNRLYWFFEQIVYGLDHFLPAVLILSFLGSEEVLGLVETLVALLTALVMYYVGRKIILDTTIMPVLKISLALLIVGAAVLGFWYTPIAILIFLGFFRVSGNIRFATSYSATMNLIDHEANGDSEAEQYAYICDNELAFNAGRIFSVGLFIFLAYLFSQEIAMRWAFLLVASMQIFGLYFMHSLLLAMRKKCTYL